MSSRPVLLFVSPRFLFPVDSGGKIRTTQILRGMKGGRFDVTLASPAPRGAAQRFAAELEQVCDRFVSWPARRRLPGFGLWRMRHITGSLPIPVATDRSWRGRRCVAAELGRRPGLAVFDFPHAHVFFSRTPGVPQVLFTHNVEAEIFLRHAAVARNALARWLWSNQQRKMHAFERHVLHQYQTVIAVSKRDAAAFAREYGLENCRVIDTGVDLEYFSYRESPSGVNVVFSGSMDWLANADGIRFLLDDIWPLVAAEFPEAQMTVVGRSPPQELMEHARASGHRWTFTGFVPDVREYLWRGSVYVIPLRVGGGTRLKAFEAMASGCPVVSTAIGVEGLPVEAGRHFLRADDARGLAAAIVRLLRDRSTAIALSRAAREHVEEHFSFRRVARQFESICMETVERVRTRDALLERQALTT